MEIRKTENYAPAFGFKPLQAVSKPSSNLVSVAKFESIKDKGCFGITLIKKLMDYPGLREFISKYKVRLITKYDCWHTYPNETFFKLGEASKWNTDANIILKSKKRGEGFWDTIKNFFSPYIKLKYSKFESCEPNKFSYAKENLIDEIKNQTFEDFESKFLREKDAKKLEKNRQIAEAKRKREALKDLCR